MLHVTNLIARVAVTRVQEVSLVWGNRATNVTKNMRLRFAEWISGHLSANVPLIISNSHAGMQHSLDVGFRPVKSMVIENGIDIDRFRRNAGAGADFRAQHNISSDAFVIAIVGRLDPMKDHTTFIRGAGAMAKVAENAVFLCVGDTRSPTYREQLRKMVVAEGIEARFRWIDSAHDIVPVYSALNVLVSASAYGEGFSNVIAEAMACEVVCVVSRVGDSARIVGDTGLTFEVGNWRALADSLVTLWSGGGKCSSACRKRISENFSRARCIERTEAALQVLVSHHTSTV
jgi:glycosyltransferase involved in cell wall biosynthesis